MRRIDVLTHPTIATHPVVMRDQNAAPFRVALTGRSTDSLGAYGQIGGHAAIGFTATAGGAPVTPDAVKWSASPDPAAAATFGTASNPTDFAALSTPGDRLYLHVTALGATITRSFPARYAPGAFAALVAQTFTEDTGGRDYTFAAATGAGLTWAYGLVSPPAGVTLAGRTVGFATDVLPLAETPYTVRATDQYGRFIDRVGLVTIQEAPAAGPWIIDGSIILASPTVAPPTVSGSNITG